ncbi:HU family DNA-binding protein [bacterium]|nr:HU family DNA-binding protein [bacterium]
MNKAELVDAIVGMMGENTTKRKAEGFIDAFTATVMEAVSKGDKVSIVGFGSFEKRHREARKGRNPRTGDTINIEAKDYPAFTPGKGFRDKVSG